MGAFAPLIYAYDFSFPTNWFTKMLLKLLKKEKNKMS